MMFRFFQLVVLLPVVAACVFGQSSPPLEAPADVSACDLIRSPQTYQGKLVRVRGRVYSSFEDFSLANPGCVDIVDAPRAKFFSIWLSYGGDADDSVTYCCGRHERTNGSELEIEGHRLSLLKDSAYQEFRDRLQAERLSRPDGTPCSDECELYRVTATLTGTFFARGTGPQAMAGPGFGHLGCCNLLVIQQISDVSAERTDIPIGEFSCASNTWKLESVQAAHLKFLRDCNPATDGNCDQYDDSSIVELAQHWKVDVSQKPKGGFENEDMHALIDWRSSDLLIRYVARGKPGSDHEDRTPATITRTICRAVPGRAPKAVKSVSCGWRTIVADDQPSWKQKFDALLDDGHISEATNMLIKSRKRLYDEGDQSWRSWAPKRASSYLLRLQALKWDIELGPELVFSECRMPDNGSAEVGVSSDCFWFSRDGLKLFEVSLLKFTGRKIEARDRTVPWVITDLSAHVCEVH